MTLYRWSVLPIWLLALVLAVLVAFFAGPAFLTWSPVALGVLVLVTFALQLALQQKEGFVIRLAASLSGAALIITIAGVLLAISYPEAIPSALWLD